MEERGVYCTVERGSSSYDAHTPRDFEKERVGDEEGVVVSCISSPATIIMKCAALVSQRMRSNSFLCVGFLPPAPSLTKISVKNTKKKSLFVERISSLLTIFLYLVYCNPRFSSDKWSSITLSGVVSFIRKRNMYLSPVPPFLSVLPLNPWRMIIIIILPSQT